MCVFSSLQSMKTSWNFPRETWKFLNKPFFNEISEPANHHYQHQDELKTVPTHVPDVARYVHRFCY